MSDEVATCRGCGRTLRGKPYWAGGYAYVPDSGERCKANFYGGWVCSPSCDYKSSLDLEQTMPGHGYEQSRIGGFALESYRRNWGDSA